jgi:hypothetical protein
MVKENFPWSKKISHGQRKFPMVKENFPQSYDVIANNKPINYKLQYFTHIKNKTSIQKTAFFSSLTTGKIRAKYFPCSFSSLVGLADGFLLLNPGSTRP